MVLSGKFLKAKFGILSGPGAVLRRVDSCSPTYLSETTVGSSGRAAKVLVAGVISSFVFDFGVTALVNCFSNTTARISILIFIGKF